MESQELDRIRFVTRHFNDLQGLRYLVPMGLLTLSVGGTAYFCEPADAAPGRVHPDGSRPDGHAGRTTGGRFGVVETPAGSMPAELESLSIYSPAGSVPRPRIPGAPAAVASGGS